MKGRTRFLQVAGVVALVQFGLSILSIYNGLIIFHSASTPGEVFWETTMEVMLFPADVLITSVAGQWGQTLMIAANSVLWGCVLTGLYYGWRGRRRPGRFAISSIESEFRRYRKLGDGVIDQLSSAQLCEAPPGSGNSVATIIWHVSGNFRSRFTDFLTTDGEKPDRDRESEFAARVVSRENVLRRWNEGWDLLFRALAELDDSHCARSVAIRGLSLSVLAALHRSLAHATYHVGQMVFLGRMLKGREWRYLSIPPGLSEQFNRNPTG